MDHSTYTLSITDLPIDILREVVPDPLECTTLQYVCKFMKDVFRGQVLPKDAVCDTAAHTDNLELVRWAAAAGYPPAIHWSVPIGNGNIPMLEWLRDHGPEWTPGDIENMGMIAATWGKLDVLKWMHNTGYRMAYGTIAYAARAGNLPMVQWLHEVAGVVVLGLLNDVGGNLELAKWLSAKGEVVTNQTLVSAAEGGHLNILEWLLTEVFSVDYYPAHMAAANRGQLHVMKWFHENGVRMTDYMLTAAAGSGELDFVKWLISVGCHWTPECFQQASVYGHVNIIEWGKDAGYPMNVDRVEFWGSTHRKVLVWIRENIRPLSADICTIATTRGNLKILQWLRSEGYSWDEKTSIEAAKWGRNDLTDWILTNGCPCDLEACAITAIGQLWSPIKTLDCLKSHGLDVNSPALRAHVVNGGHPEVIQWMQSHGARLDVVVHDDHEDQSNNDGW